MSRPRPTRSTSREDGRGHLAGHWTSTTLIVWVGITAGLAAVWAASRQIGLSTWWLGPRTGGQPAVVRLFPFGPPVVVIIAVISRARYVWVIGVIASLLVAAVGLGDIGRVDRLAIVELSLALAGLLASVAAWSGTLRPGASTAAER